MALPKSFYANSLPYTVILVENMSGWNEASGSVWPNQLKMKIDSSLPEPKQEEAFFHELQHIAATIVGINTDDTLSQEQWTTRTASTFYSILKQNGWLSFDPPRVTWPLNKVEYNIPPRSPESS